MKKLFIILFSFLCFCSSAQVPGTPIGGIIVKGGKNPGGNVLLSLSGGIHNPGSSTKTEANLVNGYAFNGNVYVPLFAHEGNRNLAGHTAHFFTVGINASGEYFTGNGDYDLTRLPFYNVSGQSSAPSVMVNTNGNKQNGFKTEIGAQANFSFGKVTLSPILNASYINLKQSAFNVTQSGAVNGTTYNKEIYNQEVNKTTGFALIPKLRIAFFPGKLGFYLEGNYTSGPEIKTQGTLFKPQGKANDNGFYSQDQMTMGSSKSITQSARYNSFGLNFGISIPLGKSTSNKRLKGKVIKTGDNGINPLYEQGGNSAENPMHNPSAQAKPGNPIGGIIVKGGKNPGPRNINTVSNENGEVKFTVTEIGEYTFQIIEPDSQGKSISEKGLNSKPSTKSKRKGRTYTGGRKNEVPNQNIQATPGNPIGGIIVKGGKNPGPRNMIAVSNENGEVTFPVTETGEYTLQITMPETSGKSINKQGVKGNPPKGKKATKKATSGLKDTLKTNV